MKQRTIGRLGALISVVLFLIGVGALGFAKFNDIASRKDLNLFSLVPANSLGVLETDNIDLLVGEFAQIAYARRLDSLQKGGIWEIIFSSIRQYIPEDSHGLGNYIHRFVVSFHSEKYVSQESIAYFSIEDSGKKVLKSLLQEHSVASSPKKEVYMGECIWIYAMQDRSFLAVYEGKGFLAVSYQKRLLEEVIRAKKEGENLWKDKSFAEGYHLKKSNFATLYTRSVSLPFLSDEYVCCWSEYDLHFNSEVFYLNGEVFKFDTRLGHVEEKLKQLPSYSGDCCLFVAGEHRVDSCVSSVSADSSRTIFEECISNLSREAMYIMVVDMEKVVESPNSFRSYLPAFLIDYAVFFRSFILSVQATEKEGHLSHIFVFTNKE